MKFIKLNLDFESTLKRTVVVPGDFSLAFLHLVIQEVFGWFDYHQYKFTLHGTSKSPEWMEPSPVGPELTDERDSATETIAAHLENKGSKLDYEYDFGDENEVTITSLGVVDSPDLKDFKVVGPMAIEDCRGFGGMDELIQIAKSGKGTQFRQLNKWLGGAFGKTTDDLLKIPDCGEIYGLVFKLVKIACVANPECLNECWMAYLQ